MNFLAKIFSENMSHWRTKFPTEIYDLRDKDPQFGVLPKL